MAATVRQIIQGSNGKRTQNKQMNEFNYKAEEASPRLQAFYVDENIKISKE